MAGAHKHLAKMWVRLLAITCLLSTVLTFVVIAAALEAGRPLATDSTENKSQNYEAWGQDVNGLRAAVEFVPEKECYNFREEIGIRFHVQNTSDWIIKLPTTSWRFGNESKCVIKDKNGKSVPVSHTWFYGDPKVDRHEILPDEVVIIECAPLAIAKDEAQAEKFNHPIAYSAVLKPGEYYLHYELKFPDIVRTDANGDVTVPLPDDWQGILVTGTVKLCVNPAQAKSIFESYFPDDPQTGEELDEYWANRENTPLSDEEFFELFRKGLRRCTVQHKGNFLMQYIGGKYIWHKDPDDQEALDIVYHASFDPEYEYYAVYSGLSVANPKSERVLKRLVDIAMEYEQLERIIWGVKASNQEDEFEQLLEPYLQDPNADSREHAQVVLKAFRGEIDAGNQKVKEISQNYAGNDEFDQEKVKQLYQQLFQQDSIQIPSAAEPSPMSATDLNTVVTLTLSEQAPFSEALAELRDSAGGKLNLTVFWRDLERVGVDRNTPVQVGPIEAMPLKTALKLLLNAVAGEEGILDWRVLDGVIVIATKPTLAKFGPETRIYDVTDLTAPPSEYRTQTSNR
jgi:hypothetical protein